MASACAQLCVSCRAPLCSRAASRTCRVSTQVRHCMAAPRSMTKLRGDQTAVRPRLRWKQQMCYYSDLAARYLTTEAKDVTSIRELSRSEPRELAPVTQSLSPLDLAAAELSALEELSDAEAVSITVPAAIPPASTSLRDYVDQSETLTRLLQLGVDLWKLEQRPNVGSMLLRLDFSTDVAPRLLFLRDVGVDEARLGYIISHNPFILTESLDNLQTRVNYLKSRSFTSAAVASMVSRAPYLLNFSVKRLDNRLGFYQQQLQLSPANTRNVVARLPRLLCGSLEPVKENLKVCEIEFGFKQTEIQHIVMTVPKVLTANKKKLTQIFDFLHNTMKVPHHLITKFPQVLNSKYLRLRERHLFLEYLHRAQYDPALAGYVSLDRLVSLPDQAFCSEVASASLDDFYLFQKTL